MQIRKAIIQFFAISNTNILDERIFFNALKDFHAFEQIPASQYIMRAFLTKGYLKDIRGGKNGWQIQSRHYLINFLGFQPDIVEYVIHEIEEGVKGLCNKNKITSKQKSFYKGTLFPNTILKDYKMELWGKSKRSLIGEEIIDLEHSISASRRIILGKYEVVKVDSMAKEMALFFFQQKEVVPTDFENRKWIGYSKTITLLRILEKAQIIGQGIDMQCRKLLIIDEKQIIQQLLTLEQINKRNIDLLKDKIYKSAYFFLHNNDADPIKLKKELSLSEQELECLINILEEIEIISKGDKLHRRVLFKRDIIQINSALKTVKDYYYPHIEMNSN